MVKLILFIVGLFFTFCTSVPISSDLQKSLQEKEKINIFLTMKEGTEQIISQISKNKYADRGQKINSLVSLLKSNAETSQNSIVQFLTQENINYKSFWISNQIYIQNADSNLITKLSSMDSIGEIREEIIVQIEETAPQKIFFGKPKDQVEWNIVKIEAVQAWEKSVGTGVKVANIDTGVRGTHETLKDTYVGDDEYGWYDPVDGTKTPTDKQGHGTHTMGTICGKNGVGVAPGCTWMSCCACNQWGGCTQPDLTSCGEFLTCPHDFNGDNKNCSRAPDIISNSWGSNTNKWFDSVLQAWREAGIIPVFSIGNVGPSCSSARYPGASALVIGTGATDVEDHISSFSGRGPYTAYENITIKPDVSAPGVNVRSAHHLSDSSYTSMSGTSMACPHIAGVIALIKSINKNATFEEVKKIFSDHTEKSLPISDGKSCGGIEELKYPNNVHGDGRVNAFRVFNSPLMQKKQK